jgi:hypothetical protein
MSRAHLTDGLWIGEKIGRMVIYILSGVALVSATLLMWSYHTYIRLLIAAWGVNQ